MPRPKKGSPEAMAWAAKMKAAREAKKVVKVPKPATKHQPTFIVDVVKGFFPDAKLKIVDRGNDYAVEILIKEGDIRAFVVDKLTAKLETQNWCAKIENNIKGIKPKVAGIGLQKGLRQGMKEVPKELGEDFFRTE